MLSSISLTRYQITTLLRTETADFDVMVSTLTMAVENAMNTTIREGQVNQANDTIRQIAGYSIKLTLMQNIVPTVLRTCVKPNMVIEQEATEAARQKAISSVENVVYLQGQNIIREGEVVSESQYEILKSLGLLENTEADLNIYLGSFILVAIGISMMLVFMHLLNASLATSIRETCVLMLVLLINLMLCVLVTKTMNLYISPVVMTAMLLTGLLGWRVSISASVCMAILGCGLAISGSTATSAEMVQLLLMGLISGVSAVWFLRGRPQRMRVVLSGLLTALTNLAAMLAVTLMTSYNHSMFLDHVGWSMGGAVLASVIALGLQPVFEAAFNIATPSKLMELANPNQPLLRRMLLEAPGTYHHSIIVANLAEAAAEKVGANPLLARTAAYYHDVGKLKRPLYFKENQIGDNPHDMADPYVSAAIVTSHTRDGVALAQKHRLPVEIQDIIAEHHGDTPVMFFYHKALQQADGSPVDINDFRYDGKHPGTKESAIIMLADTVEAAVRSMPDPTPEEIRKFIEHLVRGKLEDGQLSSAPLTLNDIDSISEAFCTVLHGVFHERIEYPAVEVPRRKQTSPAKPAPAENAATEPAAEEKTVRQEEQKTPELSSPAAEKPHETEQPKQPNEDNTAASSP